MRKIICCFAMAAAISVSAANSLRPGEGVANDHAGNVAFVQRGGGNAYGFGGSSQFVTPIGLTLLAWDIPSSISVVEGLRLNLGVGRFEKTYGVDVGAFSRSGDFAGIAVNVIGNFSERDSEGLQVGLVNVTDGAVNGLQIGLFNSAGRLNGVQIGLLNNSKAQLFFPILNAGW